MMRGHGHIVEQIGTFCIARIQLMMEVKPMIKKIEAELRTVRFKAPQPIRRVIL